MENYKQNLIEEIHDFSNQHRLSSSYRKKKLIIGTVRTFLSGVLYLIFWNYEWVRWTLILYVPLSLFNLLMIFGFNFILDRKVRSLKSKVDKQI